MRYSNICKEKEILKLWKESKYKVQIFISYNNILIVAWICKWNCE